MDRQTVQKLAMIVQSSIINNHPSITIINNHHHHHNLLTNSLIPINSDKNNTKHGS